jgi:hypothetical protein
MLGRRIRGCPVVRCVGQLRWLKGIELNPPVHKAVRKSESAFIPFVSFGDLDNNTFKGLTSLLSVEQGIQYDEHT